MALGVKGGPEDLRDRENLEGIDKAMAAIDAELHPAQLAAINTRNRRSAFHWGRRSGKSETIPRAALRAALWAPPESSIILGAETLKKAKALYWSKLLSVMLRLGLGWRTDTGTGTITTPWGAVIRLWGAKDSKQVELLRGFSPFEVHFDEVSTYFGFLRNLSTAVLGPALQDHRNAQMGGRMFFWGTPSPTRAGYWYEICNGDVPGWVPHGMDVRQNPFYDDPGAAMVEAIEENGWAWDGEDPLSCMDPEFQREWLGRFVNDPSGLVYHFNQDKNLIHELPEDYSAQEWIHTLGVDFGVVDNCAWAVLASHPHYQDVYLVHCEQSADDDKILPDDASAVTARLIQQYDPDVLVGDAGGLGKPYVEDWNRRGLAPIQMIAAEKADKRGTIALLNGEMRGGTFHALDTCSGWIDDVSCLPWRDEFRLLEDPRFPNHRPDAVLYAYRHHTAFLNSVPTPSPRDTGPAAPDWLLARRERLAAKAADPDEWWDD